MYLRVAVPVIVLSIDSVLQAKLSFPLVILHITFSFSGFNLSNLHDQGIVVLASSRGGAQHFILYLLH